MCLAFRFRPFPPSLTSGLPLPVAALLLIPARGFRLPASGFGAERSWSLGICRQVWRSGTVLVSRDVSGLEASFGRFQAECK